jgi:citrate synthase
MLPSGGRDALDFTVVVIGPGNSDPYLAHANAIQALGTHFGLTLAR